jgi:transcriptional regulator with XRE-family HTH domain
MTGSEFKRIRNIAGFTAKEFAQHIDMSVSYVYSLEQQYNLSITPRREEEFIQFLGQSVYKKALRIYELEIEQKAQQQRQIEELKKRREREEQEEAERDRIYRQQQIEEKKARRDAEMAEQIKAMESRINPVTTENFATSPIDDTKTEAPQSDKGTDTE